MPEPVGRAELASYSRLRPGLACASLAPAQTPSADSRILGRRSGGSSGATSRAAFRLLGLLVLPIRGEAAWFVHIEHGDDNQHHEPERGMEAIERPSPNGDSTRSSSQRCRRVSPGGLPGTSHIVSEPEPMFR